MTDPGYYSIHHIQFAASDCPLAMPLSAARGAWNLPFRPYLLCQPDYVEKALVHAAGIAAPVIAPHGTVAATAMDLALAATEAPVIMVGLDMSMRDISPHARPNAFDTLLQLDASRTSPHCSRLFHRAAAQHAGKPAKGGSARVSWSMRTSPGWFDELPGGAASRLFRLHPSSVALRGLNPLDDDGFVRLLARTTPTNRRPSLSPSESFPDAARRRALTLGLLSEWHSSVEEAEKAVDAKDLLSNMTTPVSLLYMICPRLLMETKSLLRRGDTAGAAMSRDRMQSESKKFLFDLARRVSDTAEQGTQYAKNHAALNGRNSRLAARVDQSRPEERIVFTTARNGARVPGLRADVATITFIPCMILRARWKSSRSPLATMDASSFWGSDRATLHGSCSSVPARMRSWLSNGARGSSVRLWTICASKTSWPIRACR